MRVPASPVPRALKRLSYSQYEAGLKCLARLAWSATGDRAAIPQSPGGILGGAFHATIREAHFGNLGADGATHVIEARAAFDRLVLQGWQNAHPLLRLKFPTPIQLPFYNLRREQASAISVMAAAEARLRGARRGGSSGTSLAGGSERWLESADHLLYGRADYVDVSQRTIVDYKSGFIDAPSDAAGASDAEARQLRFYGYLASENGVAIDKGAIVRGTGGRFEIPIPQESAAAEADAARDVLRRFNERVAEGASFDSLASPSMSSCAHCDCVPFCNRFWDEADASWSSGCGVHVEGEVAGIIALNTMGHRLVQIRLARTRGSAEHSDVAVEQVPSSWLEIDGAVLPVQGDTLRVTDARAVPQRPGVVRADKSGTAVWQL